MRWPDWWTWELDCDNPHLRKRMIDRRFSETDLRSMLQSAMSWEPDPELSTRFRIETTHNARAWRVIVEPDESQQVLIVVTAFEL